MPFITKTGLFKWSLRKTCLFTGLLYVLLKTLDIVLLIDSTYFFFLFASVIGLVAGICLVISAATKKKQWCIAYFIDFVLSVCIDVSLVLMSLIILCGADISETIGEEEFEKFKKYSIFIGVYTTLQILLSIFFVRYVYSFYKEDLEEV